MHFDLPETLKQEEMRAAAPFRGQTMRVCRVDLTNPDPEAVRHITQSVIKGVFALRPMINVRAVDQFGTHVEDGTLVFIIQSKGGEASLPQNVSRLA